jgi:hypothetical protein
VTLLYGEGTETTAASVIASTVPAGVSENVT